MCWSNIRVILAFVCILLSSAACQNEMDDSGNAAVRTAADFSLHVVGSGNSAATRSVLGKEDIETKITDATLASYDSDGKLVNAIYHANVTGSLQLYLSGSKENNVYALVNMGDMTKAFPLDEAAVGEIVYMVDSYEDIALDGIPMCGVVKGCSYKSGMSVQIPLERLFARLNARILHTDLDGASSATAFAYNMCNKSIWLRQANGRLKPFAADGSRAETAADALNVSDYNDNLDDRNAYEGSLSPSQLGPGVGYFQDTTIVLYVPENIQGILLPGNQDPFAKTGENISGIDGKNYDCLCTYLELNASRPNRGEGFSGDITYRCYLGSDNVSDFSIRRNTRYDLTLSLTDGGFHLNNWKVIRGEGWSDIRTLCFVDEPYVIYPGTVNNVILHYNRISSSVNSNSVGSVGELSYEFDSEAMAAAGLTCEFMGAEKTVGKNGYSDFYFKVTASSDAKTGVAFTIKAATADGVKSDATVVHVAEIGSLIPMWTFCPKYVSQTGELSLAGVVEGLRPLSVKVSDPTVLSCSASGTDSFSVTALRPGETEIQVSNKDGSQSLNIKMSISAPKLRVSDVSVALNPDGEYASLDYLYVDESGDPISNVDEEAYRSYLLPSVSGSSYVSVNPDMSSIGMCISKLYQNGAQIPVGNYCDVKISASDCQAAGSHAIKVFIVDPFSGMPAVYDGRIDDYTLLSTSNVPAAVRKYFEKEISASVNAVFEVPRIKSGEMYVSSSLTPLWIDYSFDNEMLRSSYAHNDQSSSLGASVSVRANAFTQSAKHSAGKHELALHVKNRHSGEFLSKTVAILDVYVHTAIGASASFGSLVCSYPSGGSASSSTVAGIYNSIAGVNLYSPTSSNKIFYMDVSVDFLTDISNVRVLNLMRQGVDDHRNVMDGLDVVRPSVNDGQMNTDLRVLYSVGAGDGQRFAMCGETYGMRRGIGAMLYRALAFPSRSETLTEQQMMALFLGPGVSTGMTTSKYAPCYTIHDMNKGADMSKNTVSKNVPLYFSPSSFSSYRDASGRGYHVIHPLESIVPGAWGWSNLL